MNTKNRIKGSRAGIFIFLLSLASIFNVAAQENESESRFYDTGEFTGLFLEGAFGVQLIQGSSGSLEVRASDSKAFDYLNITNNNGLLHLHVDRKPFDFSRLTLYVTFETLKSLRIFGSIRMDTQGYIDLDDLKVLLEGGAKVNLQVTARHIGIENRGGVLCELSGVAESLDVLLAGAGHINAGELRTKDVNFRIEGVGTAKVFATEKLNAVIKGAGKVRYRGNPNVTQNIEGLGSVERE